MTLRLRYTPAPAARGVLAFASQTVLKCAVVLLGATFGLAQVAHIGRTSLPLMLGTLVVALVAAWLVGRALGVGGNLQTLVGVGTAICGASAIGAVSGVIGAAESEIAYAISTIFVFNVVAVVLYPALGHLLSLSQHGFGLWAGTAINDTSSVVAAAYTYGHTAGNVAVVTKLARTTMIIPIVLGLAAMHARRPGSAQRPLWRLVPAFLIWFLLASALNTARTDQPEPCFRPPAGCNAADHRRPGSDRPLDPVLRAPAHRPSTPRARGCALGRRRGDRTAPPGRAVIAPISAGA